MTIGKKGKVIKDIQIRKEGQNSAFEVDILLYVKNFKKYTKKLQEPLNKLYKFAGFKINIQNSIICTSNENPKQN